MKTALRLSSGSIEALKWLGVVLMTGDHINTVFFARGVPILYDLGRIAFPLFALVMAYNLARPGADSLRSAQRLAVFALVTTPAYVYSVGGGHLVPFNVLYTFAAAALVVYLSPRQPFAALAVFVLAGAVVDYGWPGLGLIVAGTNYFATRSRLAAVATLLALASLVLINGNFWALAAAPVVAIASLSAPALKRAPRAFYGYYLGHLTLLSFFVL